MSTSDGKFAYDKSTLPDASLFRIGVVVADWNHEITEALYQGAFSTLLDCGVPEQHIIHVKVPGSFELVTGARSIVEHEKVDAVICLGCLVQGETRHFEFISNAVAQGLTLLAVRFSKPFIFGVLTTDTMQQARDRAGGKLGNKGVESAVAAIRMAGLKDQFPGGKKIGFT